MHLTPLRDRRRSGRDTAVAMIITLSTSSSSSSSISRRTMIGGWFLLVTITTTFTCPSAAFASSFANVVVNNSKTSQLQQQQHPRKHFFLTKPKRLSLLTTTASSSNNENEDTKITAEDDEEGTILQTSSSSQQHDHQEEEDPRNDHSLEELENLEMAALRGGASGVVGSSPPPPQPTLHQYFKFALPCLALWVAGPLLSLVDTSFVGLSAAAASGGGGGATSAQQLAALGPATTFFDGATYLFAFLNVATTNLYSSARAQKGADSAKAESVVRTSAQVALRSGLGLMLFLLTCARPLLKLYIGDKAASTPGLLNAATDYVSIRALSMPTSLLLGVLQAALLGAKDSVTPLIAIVYCTVVNVVGDFLLVNRLHWGLQGAAIATTLAQWAATAALIPAARRKLVKNHNLGLLVWKKKSKASSSAASTGTTQPEDTVTGRAFLGFAAPVLTLILGKIAAFGFMTHSAAAVPGQPTPLASHQIILSLLFFCSPFLEVLSQTAQTFLPPFLAPVNDHVKAQKAKNAAYSVNQDSVVAPWLEACQKVATSLLGIGFVAAAGVASAASLIPAFFGNMITTDATIQNAVKPLAKYLWMGAFFWAPVAVSEGVLLARLELTFLAGTYMVSTALLPPALLQIKHRQGTVEQVWACFVVFQLCRAVAFTARIWGGFAVQRIFGRSKKQNLPKTA